MKSVSAGCRVLLDDVKETKQSMAYRMLEKTWERRVCVHSNILSTHSLFVWYTHTHIHKYVTVYQAFFCSVSVLPLNRVDRCWHRCLIPFSLYSIIIDMWRLQCSRSERNLLIMILFKVIRSCEFIFWNVFKGSCLWSAKSRRAARQFTVIGWTFDQ